MASPLKDRLGEREIETLAGRFARVCADFDPEAYIAEMTGPLAKLELKDRVGLLADGIAGHLPGSYVEALSAVVQVAAEGIDEWAAWPLCSFVERHGVGFPLESLDAMAVLTTQWSCEFALRPFLDVHLEMTRVHLRRWVLDPDESVRRLASEGTRPLLPWTPRVRCLTDDPTIGIEVLEALRYDKSETVRRSVANHLNDISKSRPELVVDLLSRWSEPPRPVDRRMVSHALRTLAKRGNLGALALLGFTTDPSIDISEFRCAPIALALGGQIELSVQITSTARQSQLLVVDFVIHHVTASGSASPKVFKWKTLRIDAGETAHLAKHRRIRPTSTRRYHEGQHRVDLQVAGRTIATTSFDLSVTPDDADQFDSTNPP